MWPHLLQTHIQQFKSLQTYDGYMHFHFRNGLVYAMILL
ncbi:hypothetical protein SpAn4DRAFT_2235 [Sporomusa ovata]|uniref:Uncharacterized protein n=1 Tax=Sporomusa ovata TaxID=2378 RepID=A0A0U1L1G4_9FIRM|nr:hypothetical protein SpAn4DRAFT_2235 [Sporomusa ovata]